MPSPLSCPTASTTSSTNLDWQTGMRGALIETVPAPRQDPWARAQAEPNPHLAAPLRLSAGLWAGMADYAMVFDGCMFLRCSDEQGSTAINNVVVARPTRRQLPGIALQYCSRRKQQPGPSRPSNPSKPHECLAVTLASHFTRANQRRSASPPDSAPRGNRNDELPGQACQVSHQRLHMSLLSMIVLIVGEENTGRWRRALYRWRRGG